MSEDNGTNSVAAHPPTSPADVKTDNAPTAEVSVDDVAMLLEFLRTHDMPCPVCKYNLRGLCRPVCPECQQQLTLTVGPTRMRLEWLLIGLSPGIFAGITAIFVLGMMIIAAIQGAGPAPWPIIAADVFGCASGLFTIALAVMRGRFLAMPIASQRQWAIMLWIIHVVAFFTWLLFMMVH